MFSTVSNTFCVAPPPQFSFNSCSLWYYNTPIGRVFPPTPPTPLPTSEEISEGYCALSTVLYPNFLEEYNMWVTQKWLPSSIYIFILLAALLITCAAVSMDIWTLCLHLALSILKDQLLHYCRC